MDVFTGHRISQGSGRLTCSIFLYFKSSLSSTQKDPFDLVRLLETSLVIEHFKISRYPTSNQKTYG